MTSVIKATLTRTQLNVLLIEDNADEAELIEELLLESRIAKNLIFSNATSLGQALEILRQESFDVILLDLTLPDSQENDTVVRIQEYSLNIPIVVLTATNNEELALYSIQAGVQDYLLKRKLDSQLLSRSIRYAIERLHTQEILRQSEEKYRSVVESIKEVIFQIDATGHWTFLNPAWTEITGFLVGESLGQPFFHYVFPEDRHQAFTEFLALIQGNKEESRHQIRYRTTTGSCRWIEVHERVTKNPDGQVSGVAGTLNDITEQVLAQAQLKEITRFQQAVLNSANYAIISTTPDGIIRTFNAAAEKMLGYSAQEVVGMTTPALIHDPEEVAQRAGELSAELGINIEPGFDVFVAKARQGEIEEREWTYIRKDGSCFPVLLSISAVRDEAGEITGFTGIANDITKRKQAEDELRESQHFIEKIATSSPNILYLYDLKNGRNLYVNLEIAHSLGYLPLEIRAMGENVLASLMHPEDLAKLPQYYTQLEAGADGEIFEIEYRMKCRDGLWRWFISRDTIFARTEQGTPAQILGTATDITERKQVEEEIRLLLAATQAISDCSDIHEALAVILRLISQTINWNLGEVWVPNESGKLLECSRGWYASDPELEAFRLHSQTLNFAPNIGLPGRIWVSQRSEWIEDISQTESSVFLRKELATEFGLKTCFGMPILASGRVLAVLVFFSRIKIAKQLRLVELANAVAIQLSSHIQRKLAEAEKTKLIASLQELTDKLQEAQKIAHIGNWEFDVLRGTFTWSDELFRIFGYESGHPPTFDELVELIYEEDRERWLTTIHEAIVEGTEYEIDHRICRPDGEIRYINTKGQAVKSEAGYPLRLIGTAIDISDRKQAENYLQESEARERLKAVQLELALQKLRSAQAHLVQNEKMVSLGQLVAGVAHEINNPVNFIYGNLNPALQYTSELLDLLQLYQQQYSQPSPEIVKKIQQIDLEYIAQDLPKLFKSMKVGADRILQIVKSLRTFSRLDEAEMKRVDIREGIESTLMILQHRLKPCGKNLGIQIIKQYEPLPPIECCAGQLNQVFMNILCNAIDALEERDKGRSAAQIEANPSTIIIHTYLCNKERAVISIADNGPGIPDAVRERLFDPFFTTKPVGKGTGLGLSISHSIVVERHGGQLICLSIPGQGSEFLIEIPVRQLGANS